MLLIDPPPPHPEKYPWKYIPISQYLFPISGSYSKQLICESAQNALSKGLHCWTHSEDRKAKQNKELRDIIPGMVHRWGY